MSIPPARFRLPDATRVGAVHLLVSDLARSVDFYQQVIGLHAAERSAGSVTLTAHDDARPLVRLVEQPGARPAPRRGAYGLFHFAILLPDRGALARFAGHLSACDLRVGTADHLVSEAFYLTDPDGLGVEVYADRPRHLWRYDGRELMMTTEPLDTADLISADDGAWDGAPPGTTVGHVHLYVGDLDVAAAFYHQGLGFDKTVWRYPGALFFAAGGYHHHLGTNTWSPGPAATERQARLLEWELVVPGNGQAAAAESLAGSGYAQDAQGAGYVVADPWGTRVRLVTCDLTTPVHE